RSKRDWSSDVCSSDLDRQRMCLERPFRLGGNARIGPFLAVERVNAGPANVEFAVVAAHGVGKTPTRSAFGKDFGLPPTVFALLRSEERRVGKECRCGW